jgi:hypothetical protein
MADGERNWGGEKRRRGGETKLIAGSAGDLGVDDARTLPPAVFSDCVEGKSCRRRAGRWGDRGAGERLEGGRLSFKL